jgi:hypothetical protein
LEPGELESTKLSAVALRLAVAPEAVAATEHTAIAVAVNLISLRKRHPTVSAPIACLPSHHVKDCDRTPGIRREYAFCSRYDQDT